MIRARGEIDMRPADGLRKGGIRRALRIGLNRAASPVKASVVSHAEGVRRFGFLAKSIRIRLRVYPGDRWVAVIGPSTRYTRQKGKFKTGKRAGQPRKSVPAKYAHLVERGTARSKARPWLRPAHDATSAGFLRTAAAEIGREIDQQLRQAAGTTRGTR